MQIFDMNRPEFLNGPRVCPHDVDGVRVWVKRPEASRTPHWHIVQNMLSRCIPFPMLRPTASPGGALALFEEASRLKQWAGAGIHVPYVLGVNDKILVTADAGEELKQHLHSLAPQEQTVLLKEAARALGRLHAAGFAHGRPYLKDFVWRETTQEIGFLDLEENPTQVMPLAYAQARDIWLFLGSCAQFYPNDQTHHLLTLYRLYRGVAGETHRAPLQKLWRYLKPVLWVAERVHLERLGKDARRAIAATRVLEDIYEGEAQ